MHKGFCLARISKSTEKVPVNIRIKVEKCEEISYRIT